MIILISVTMQMMKINADKKALYTFPQPYIDIQLSYEFICLSSFAISMYIKGLFLCITYFINNSCR